MAVTTIAPSGQAAPKASLLYRPEVRAAIYQILLVVGLAYLFYSIVSNAAENLRRANIASGFGFWDRTAGFDVGQSLINYSATSTYGEAFLVGVLNTLLVAVIGIVIATILGFIIGIARLSKNWIISNLANAYVELLRNMPLLLQLFFWYFAVLKALPQARAALSLPGGAYLSNRGLNMPSPVAEAGFGIVMIVLAFAVVASLLIGQWAKRRRLLTGQPFPVYWTALGLIVLLPLAAALLLGRPMTWDYPIKGNFNFSGGVTVLPEFLALLFGLSLYTAAFIAEIVRSGILAVSKGQKEAAAALGLHTGQALRLVVIPQAMRIIIPPLTSQYLNLTKNSSLGLAIAYPDLVSVTGTMLNQTGQAVEIILLMMGVYLTISLLTSLFMNWFNASMALVER